jgi:hypothetical protein
MAHVRTAGADSAAGRTQLIDATASLAAVIRIAISTEAYAAIASILPPGTNVGPLERAPNGQYRVWLPRAVVDRLARMRGPRESYSEVILRLAAGGEPG